MTENHPTLLAAMEGQAPGSQHLLATSSSKQSEKALECSTLSPASIQALTLNHDECEADNSPASPTLTTIPPELHVHLFKFLDPVTATCLALTCKKIYQVYQAVDLSDGTKPVPLHEMLSEKNQHHRMRPEDPRVIRLGDLLCVWAGKGRDLVYWPRGRKWVLAEKGQELKEHRQFYIRRVYSRFRLGRRCYGLGTHSGLFRAA
jgi:hypothetical protein